VGGIAVLAQPARQAVAKLSRTTLLHVMVRDGTSELWGNPKRIRSREMAQAAPAAYQNA